MTGTDRAARAGAALSRDATRLDALRRSLAAYRLVFGQPRQDDLMAYLQARFSPEEIRELLDDLCIDLSPRPVRGRSGASWRDTP